MLIVAIKSSIPEVQNRPQYCRAAVSVPRTPLRVNHPYEKGSVMRRSPRARDGVARKLIVQASGHTRADDVI